LDASSLEKNFQNIDWVFHLAGVIAYRKKDRPLMEQVNVQGTANVISACLKNKVSRLIYMSSVVAIGSSFDEKTILNEDSEYKIGKLNLGYFETKRKAEALVRKSVLENNLDAVILNPSTIYGAGDAEKGSRSVQVKVAKGKFPFYTGGGVNVVGVEDVIQALITAAKIGRKGERYILSGENMTIQQLFQTIAKHAGVESPKTKLPDFLLHSLGWVGDLLDRMGLKGPISQENAWTSTMFHWFDNQKAQKELNFHPRPSEIAIKNSVNWMKENKII
jgi:dihydroflavonol-4-reductase